MPDVAELVAAIGGVLAGGRCTRLKQGTLEIERLRDANISAPAEGDAKVV